MRDQDAALEVLAAAQQAVEMTGQAVGEIKELVGRFDEAARLEPVVLTAAEPSKVSDSRETSKSIAVLNPHAFPIFIGLTGGRASRGARAISCPARSLIVLPVAAEDVELGVDAADQAALAGGDAVVHLLRYKTAQPAFLGSQ